MGARLGQKPSYVLVVAGGGLEVCFSPVCHVRNIRYLSPVWKLIHMTIFTSVTAIVFPHSMARMRSFLFTIVIQYR